MKIQLSNITRLFIAFYLFSEQVKSDVYKEEICLDIRYSKYGHFKGNASCFILICDVLNEDVLVIVIEVEPFYKWPIIVSFFYQSGKMACQENAYVTEV